MSHTGVVDVGSRRAARRISGASALVTPHRVAPGHPWNQARAGFIIPPTMPFISGKQAFLQILRQEGVSVMFGNPGTTELPLMDGLAREPGIRYVLALQEAPAIAMTDGYAQASGGLGAVNVHVSPGLGNAMGMLYDAYIARVRRCQAFTLTATIKTVVDLVKLAPRLLPRRRWFL